MNIQEQKAIELPETLKIGNASVPESLFENPWVWAAYIVLLAFALYAIYLWRNTGK